MRQRRAFIPSALAPLENRIALSHSGLALSLRGQPALIQSQSVNLYGFVLGSDKVVKTVHHLSASGGTISPLGRVSLNGYLVIPNEVGVNRPVHGSVTISNAHGSVTVSLAGRVTVYESSFRWASGNLTYKIVGGSKAYRAAKGTGHVLYGPGPVFIPGRFLLDFGNFPPPP
jgi:hypothetical protein